MCSCLTAFVLEGSHLVIIMVARFVSVNENDVKLMLLLCKGQKAFLCWTCPER